MNEDWDDQCAKCGAASAPPDPAPDDLDYQATQVAAARVPAEAPPARRRSNPVALIITLVIVVSILGLAAVGWYAWQQGLIQFNLPGTVADDTGLAGEGSALVASEGQDTQESSAVPGDSFEHMLAGGTKSYKPYRDVVDSLVQTRQFLAQTTLPSAGEEGWSEAEFSDLDALAGQSGQLLAAFQEFAEESARQNSEKYAVAQLVLEEEFTRQFVAVYDRLGAFYAGDLSGTNSAYVLSDTIADAIDQSGLMDTQRLRSFWLEATKQREQFLLDLTLKEEFAQLNARLSAAREVQYQFRQTAQSLPAPEVRHNKLNQGALDLLSLLDSYAFTWEEFYLEFEEYQATLPERQLSEQLEAELESYQQLIEDTHLLCFTEVYKLYAQDEDLHHDSYWNLETHLAFAELHWPEREVDYRTVYLKYTADWDRMFRD